MKALLGIALGAAAIYFTLKATARRGRAVPTLQPPSDTERSPPDPLRDSGQYVAQRVPF